MDDDSGYLRYLPPVLREGGGPGTAGFSLGAFLRIFEKMLTGIDDGVAVRHGNHEHEPITGQIARLDRLLDPWKTPEEFLPWLASWVALEFPTLQGKPLWDTYQRRKATAGIAGIYRRRGLKSGLNAYLELYAVGATRPRVALDDGSRLLVTTPRAGRRAPVTALVTQGPVLGQGGAVTAEGLIRPWSAAIGADGSLFVADTGIPATIPLNLKNRVWRMSHTGHYDLSGTPPRPQPLAPDLTLVRVTAVAVRPAQGGEPERLYVLDRTGKLFAIAAPYTGQPAVTVASLTSGGSTFWPVAMAVDVNGDLLVLDRGDGPGTANPPKIISVTPQPLAVARRSLSLVAEPLSLLVRPSGDLVIGDGRDQHPAPGDPTRSSGNLVAVDRTSNPALWTERLLLPEDPAAGNPLVAPTGITLTGGDALAGGDALHVLDAGVKPFVPPDDPFVLAVAEPAGVFRVDLAAVAPVVTRVSEDGHLVFPTGMVADGERLIICDPGQPEVPGVVPPVWPRLLPFRFDVVVHFAEGRLPADPDERATVKRQVIGNIRSIVEQQRPAHTVWDPVF
jgi:phage tail-like protein